MKKALSLLLAIVMVFALATNAFAARLVGGSDGVESFFDTSTNSDPNTQIKITAVSGQVGHRYAVDIDFVTMAVQVNGSDLVWDVDEHQYVQNDPEGGIGGEDKRFDVVVTNHSDMPVYLTTDVDDGDTNDFVVVKTVIKNSATELDDKTEIISALDNGNAAYAYTFEVLVTTEGGDWTDVSNYYVPKFNQSNDPKLLATVDLTISMTAPVTP